MRPTSLANRLRPYYARPSWSDRFRLRTVFAVVAEAAVLVAGLLAIPALIFVLGAPK